MSSATATMKQLEGELVVGPEERDDEVLGARRLEVDDDLADRGDERGRAGEEPGQQLGDAERRGGGDDAGDRRGRHGRARCVDGRRLREVARLRCSPAIIAARCDVRMSRSAARRAAQRAQARRPSAARRDRQPERPAQDVAAQDLVERPGRDGAARRPAPARG